MRHARIYSGSQRRWWNCNPLYSNGAYVGSAQEDKPKTAAWSEEHVVEVMERYGAEYKLKVHWDDMNIVELKPAKRAIEI